MNVKKLLKNLFFNAPLESTKQNYWTSIIFIIIAVATLALWGYTSLNMALLFANNAWHPQITTTYDALSFLSMMNGVALITGIVTFPAVIFGFAFYVWHLSSRIRKLEEQAKGVA